MTPRLPLRSRLGLAAAGALTALAGTLAATVGAAAPAQAATLSPVVGNDISWPNCPKGMGIPSRRSEGEPMPATTTGFVIIGLTNGPGFYPNPCLASQVAWAKKNHRLTGMYAMTTFPNSAEQARYGASGPWRGSDTLTRIRNAGYAEAKFNLTNASAAGLASSFIWVDVEDYPVAPWTGNATWNRAAVEGALRGYHDAGVRTGIYSIVGMWNRLTGSWRNGLPLWDAVGGDGQRAATNRCYAPSFTGGRRLMTQWTSGHHDVDITCPGVTGTTASPSPLAPFRAATVRVGSRGSAVAAAQRVVGAGADGSFGPKTRAKVVAFQHAKHLTATGAFGPAEWRAAGAYGTVPGAASALPGLFTRY